MLVVRNGATFCRVEENDSRGGQKRGFLRLQCFPLSSVMTSAQHGDYTAACMSSRSFYTSLLGSPLRQLSRALIEGLASVVIFLFLRSLFPRSGDAHVLEIFCAKLEENGDGAGRAASSLRALLPCPKERTFNARLYLIMGVFNQVSSDVLQFYSESGLTGFASIAAFCLLVANIWRMGLDLARTKSDAEKLQRPKKTPCRKTSAGGPLDGIDGLLVSSGSPSPPSRKASKESRDLSVNSKGTPDRNAGGAFGRHDANNEVAQVQERRDVLMEVDFLWSWNIFAWQIFAFALLGYSIARLRALAAPYAIVFASLGGCSVISTCYGSAICSVTHVLAVMQNPPSSNEFIKVQKVFELPSATADINAFALFLAKKVGLFKESATQKPKTNRQSKTQICDSSANVEYDLCESSASTSTSKSGRPHPHGAKSKVSLRKNKASASRSDLNLLNSEDADTTSALTNTSQEERLNDNDNDSPLATPLQLTLRRRRFPSWAMQLISLVFSTLVAAGLIRYYRVQVALVPCGSADGAKIGVAAGIRNFFCSRGAVYKSKGATDMLELSSFINRHLLNTPNREERFSRPLLPSAKGTSGDIDEIARKRPRIAWTTDLRSTDINSGAGMHVSSQSQTDPQQGKPVVVAASMSTSGALRLFTRANLVVHPHFESEKLRQRVQLLYSGLYHCPKPQVFAERILDKLQANFVVVENHRCFFTPFVVDRAFQRNLTGSNCAAGERYTPMDLICRTLLRSPKYFRLRYANSAYSLYERLQGLRRNQDEDVLDEDEPSPEEEMPLSLYRDTQVSLAASSSELFEIDGVGEGLNGALPVETTLLDSKYWRAVVAESDADAGSLATFAATFFENDRHAGRDTRTLQEIGVALLDSLEGLFPENAVVKFLKGRFMDYVLQRKEPAMRLYSGAFYAMHPLPHRLSDGSFVVDVLNKTTKRPDGNVLITQGLRDEVSAAVSRILATGFSSRTLVAGGRYEQNQEEEPAKSPNAVAAMEFLLFLDLQLKDPAESRRAVLAILNAGFDWSPRGSSAHNTRLLCDVAVSIKEAFGLRDAAKRVIQYISHTLSPTHNCLETNYELITGQKLVPAAARSSSESSKSSSPFHSWDYFRVALRGRMPQDFHPQIGIPLRGFAVGTEKALGRWQ
ncbi:unnamed protein product [Amoebophrya sp. A25]|nr:unnamed protein product [Amoebophrya sp. A25]|eukprot:GSA25T00013545001.1